MPSSVLAVVIPDDLNLSASSDSRHVDGAVRSVGIAWRTYDPWRQPADGYRRAPGPSAIRRTERLDLPIPALQVAKDHHEPTAPVRKRLHAPNAWRHARPRVDRADLPCASAVLGAGAVTFTSPFLVRGTPGAVYLSHCAAADAASTAKTTQIFPMVTSRSRVYTAIIFSR